MTPTIKCFAQGMQKSIFALLYFKQGIVKMILFLVLWKRNSIHLSHTICYKRVLQKIVNFSTWLLINFEISLWLNMNHIRNYVKICRNLFWILQIMLKLLFKIQNCFTCYIFWYTIPEFQSVIKKSSLTAWSVNTFTFKILFLLSIIVSPRIGQGEPPDLGGRFTMSWLVYSGRIIWVFLTMCIL